MQKFVLLFLVLAAMHWILFVLYPNGIQKSIFFAGGADYMADFFNPLRYIADKNPYFGEVGDPWEKGYLPFAYLLLFPFSRLDDYANMSLQMCWDSHIALISAMVFTLISCFFFYFSLKKLCEKWGVSCVILIPLLLSGVFVSTVERANLIMISMACVTYFIALYDSENPLEHNIAIIMLAVAAVLKVYPAFFGLLYLKKKMYRELLLAAGLSFLLAIVPFLFFENGLKNIPRLISNASLNSEVYGGLNRISPHFGINYLIYSFLNLMGIFDVGIRTTLSDAGWALLKLLAVLALVTSFTVKDEYNSLLLLALGLMFLPENSGLYCGLYLFPAIIRLFRNGEQNRKLTLYHAAFFLFYLSPLQYGFYYQGAHNQWLIGTNYLIVLAMVLFLILNLVRVLSCSRQ